MGDDVTTDRSRQHEHRARPPSRAAPVLPDYDGACTSNIVDVLVEDPDHPPAWFPDGARGCGPDRAARARRARVAADAGAPLAAPRSHADGVDADHDRRADHHRHRADLHLHGPAARRARRDRLPHGGRPRRAERAAVDHRRRATHARSSRRSRSRPTSPSVANGRPWWCGRSSATPASPGRTWAAADTSRTGCPRRCSPRSPTSSPQVSRSSTPTTTASTRSPTSTA